MRKIAKFAIIVLLGAICIFASCNNNRPMQFDKERWTQSGGWEGSYFIGDDHFVSGNTRYRMALWLGENYSFENKSLNDVLEKFFITPTPSDKRYQVNSRHLERVKDERMLRIVTKQHCPNTMFTIFGKPFGIGIHPPINTDWLEFHFDENLIVSKVYNVHYDRREPRGRGNETRRKIQ